MPPDSSGHLVILKDIAGELGVSNMSVSRALRGAPGVGKVLRARVESLAREMGYSPDPVLSALNAHRTRKLDSKESSTLVLVHDFPTTSGMFAHHPFIQSYYAGFQRQASALGYRTEPFCLRDPGMTPLRAAGILYHRGIRGVIFAPLPPARKTRWLRLPVDHFAVVALGPSLLRPAVDRVAIRFHRSVKIACHHLRHLGYRRIGLALPELVDQKFGYVFSDTLRGEQLRYPRTGTVPPLIWSRKSPAAEIKREIRVWNRAHRPDALLTYRAREIHDFQGSGARPGNKPLLVDLSIYSGERAHCVGIFEDLEHLGVTAVKMLHRKLLCGESGIPASPGHYEIDGIWNYPDLSRDIEPEGRRA
jgi:DNA-binding LacI/PurR family transcriptional regulator